MSDKPNYNMTGILFRQEEKETEQHPDYTGNITFNNVEYELAGWIQQGKKVKFLKLKVSEKRRKDVSGTVPATSASGPRTKTPTAQQARPGGRSPSYEQSYEDGKEEDANSGMDGWDEDNAPPF